VGEVLAAVPYHCYHSHGKSLRWSIESKLGLAAYIYIYRNVPSSSVRILYYSQNNFASFHWKTSCGSHLSMTMLAYPVIINSHVLIHEVATGVLHLKHSQVAMKRLSNYQDWFRKATIWVSQKLFVSTLCINPYTYRSQLRRLLNQPLRHALMHPRFNPLSHISD